MPSGTQPSADCSEGAPSRQGPQGQKVVAMVGQPPSIVALSLRTKVCVYIMHIYIYTYLCMLHDACIVYILRCICLQVALGSGCGRRARPA